MVNNPGAYDIGAMSKTINALVASGGLSDESSLGNIEFLIWGSKKEVDPQFLVLGIHRAIYFFQTGHLLVVL